MAKKISTIIALVLAIITGLSIFNVISKDQAGELEAWLPSLGTSIGAIIAIYTDGKVTDKNIW
jgi:uncharacterized membrane protein